VKITCEDQAAARSDSLRDPATCTSDQIGQLAPDERSLFVSVKLPDLFRSQIGQALIFAVYLSSKFNRSRRAVRISSSRENLGECERYSDCAFACVKVTPVSIFGQAMEAFKESGNSAGTIRLLDIWLARVGARTEAEDQPTTTHLAVGRYARSRIWSMFFGDSLLAA